jgi:protein phosphatase
MFQAFGASDPGCIRANNEDNFLVAPDAGLYLVADGMGGAQAGETASKLAIETVLSAVQQDAGIGAEGLAAAFSAANQRIKQTASTDRRLEGMGTTLVAVLEHGDDVVIASVGDSRAYLFSNGKLEPITEDQTWVNEVGRKLGLTEEVLKSHPMRHVLTMALGVSDQLRVNTYSVRPAPGTVLLLSSDGLHGVVPHEVIARILGKKLSLAERCHRLIKEARMNGGPDNITVVLLERTQEPGRRLAPEKTQPPMPPSGSTVTGG